jgi:hypothetical protein
MRRSRRQLLPFQRRMKQLAREELPMALQLESGVRSRAVAVPIGTSAVVPLAQQVMDQGRLLLALEQRVGRLEDLTGEE